MSLVSQITAAFQAVATAMGKEQDWATSFTSKLTTPTGATAASKTVPGIVQLATTTQAIAGTDDSAALTSADLAAVTSTESRAGIVQLATASEVAAGTVATKGVSPVQLATAFTNSRVSPAFSGTPTSTTPPINDNSTKIATTSWVQSNSGVRVGSFTDMGNLYASANRPPAGTIIYLGPCTDGGFNHYGSEWRVTANGQFSPVANIPILVDNVAGVNSLSYVYNNAWKNTFALFEHRVTSVSITAPYDQSPAYVGTKWEYRWDAVDLNAFHLWPTADTYSNIYYGGGTDYTVYANGYTVLTFDSWDFNGLNCQYGLGSAPNLNFSVPAQGRYEFVWGCAITNDDQTERYMFTTYNATRAVDFQTGSVGLFADRPFQQTSNHWCAAGDQIRFAIHRPGTGNQWIRRGNGSFQYARPRALIKYVGWK